MVFTHGSSNYEISKRVREKALAVMEGAIDAELHDATDINSNESIELVEAKWLVAQWEDGNYNAMPRLSKLK